MLRTGVLKVLHADPKDSASESYGLRGASENLDAKKHICDVRTPRHKKENMHKINSFRNIETYTYF